MSKRAREKDGSKSAGGAEASPPAARALRGDGPALGPLARGAAAASSYALLLAATPGAVFASGSASLAVLALVPWALACSRPGRRAVLAEWLAGAVLGLELYWVYYVFGPLPLWVCAGMGFYTAFAGVLLRRLAARLPLGLACGLAWTGMEALRSFVPPPFGLGWQLLAHHAAAVPEIAGSARVWGPFGLSFALACASGALAGLARNALSKRREGVQPSAALESRAARRTHPVGDALAGLAPLALALLLSLAVSAPETEPGPRVLLVQPAFEQARKQRSGDASTLHKESRELTRGGLAELEARGEPPPDLVVWGETMLYVDLADEGLAAALDAGARSAPWLGNVDQALVQRWERTEDLRVRRGLLAPSGALPSGTSFASGALLWIAGEDGSVRPGNALALWSGDGSRQVAGKVHLAPGAETALGLEKIAWVRDAVFAVAGYVPDMHAWQRAEVLELGAREGGGSWRFTASVCFDNAFPFLYAEALRRGPLDFHLVVSNEAWFLESFEMDQMVAFSRLIAIATGRSVVRAGNAGVTLALDPEGREVARLVVDGRDRHVPGILCVGVPVPLAGESGALTPFARFAGAWFALFLLGPPLIAVAASRNRRNRSSWRG